MNLLSLRLDQKRKIKLTRWYYHVQDDGLLGLWIVAALLVAALGILGIDKAFGSLR